MPEAERCRAEQIAYRTHALLAFPLRRGKPAGETIEGFRRAPVLLLPIRGEFERDNRDRQVECAGKTGGVVLKQFGGAGSGDDNRLRAESLISFSDGSLEQLGCIRAEVPSLESRVGDRRT